MRKALEKLARLFFPPPGTPLWRRLLPYALLGLLTLMALVAAAYGWDYTNSPAFCGTTCHTMPPEYSAYLVSPHARIDCVECHIGRGFIATRVTRKASDINHIISLLFRTYEFPIRAKSLRPARETCERCHFPEKFSDDSLRKIKHYNDDKANTPTTIYLTLKTGGGTRRQGLGRGIHWHIVNQVFYLPLDPEEQQIPYVRVVDEQGMVTEYRALDSGIDPANVDLSSLERMDCITCHNRITHIIQPPHIAVDQLISRGAISPLIPEIKLKAVEALENQYASVELALNGIAGLEGYYQVVYPQFYADAQNRQLIDSAIQALQQTYAASVFPEQKADWNTHRNNIGHEDAPGCFRCHDGKHLNENGEAIRLECNLCHSIPVVVGPQDFVAEIEISRGPEPESHLNANWIALHREVFDDSCSTCHTTEDAGGISNTSFCSNSACHGMVWEYAGFNAPGLREILQAQITPTPMPPALGAGPLTFADTIGQIFSQHCTHCHGQDGIQGLDLTSLQTVLQGGDSGPAIVPGDPESSLLLKKVAGEKPHFAQLSPEELDFVVKWIEAGAP